MNGWQYYGTKTLQVCPCMKGTPVYRDGMLPYLYTRTREEGNIQATFCGDDLNMDAFVAFFEKRKTLQVLCTVENDKTLKPAGFSWVDMPKGIDGARSVSCGFCFFREARLVARDLARLAVAYCLIDLKVDVIFGVQLVTNIPALNFSRRLGFREACVVPKYLYADGALVDARVMILEGTDWLPGFEKWFAEKKIVEQSL